MKKVIDSRHTYYQDEPVQLLLKQLDSFLTRKVCTSSGEEDPSPLFTVSVTMQPIVGAEVCKKLLITQVNFGRGVRNKFHSHTLEQILIVTEGKGIVATEKEQITVVPGDVIFIPPGEKHWHGAASSATFSHLYLMSPDSKTTQLED